MESPENESLKLMTFFQVSFGEFKLSRSTDCQSLDRAFRSLEAVRVEAS